MNNFFFFSTQSSGPILNEYQITEKVQKLSGELEATKAYANLLEVIADTKKLKPVDIVQRMRKIRAGLNECYIQENIINQHIRYSTIQNNRSNEIHRSQQNTAEFASIYYQKLADFKETIIEFCDCVIEFCHSLSILQREEQKHNPCNSIQERDIQKLVLITQTWFFRDMVKELTLHKRIETRDIVALVEDRQISSPRIAPRALCA